MNGREMGFRVDDLWLWWTCVTGQLALFFSHLFHLTLPTESPNWVFFRTAKLKSSVFSFMFQMPFCPVVKFTAAPVAITGLFAVLAQYLCKLAIKRDSLTWSNSLVLPKGVIQFPLLVWHPSSTASLAAAPVLFWHFRDECSSLSQQKTVFCWVSSLLADWLELAHQGDHISTDAY